MGNVCTIITLALHHKSLGPDGLLRGAKLDWQTEDPGIEGVFKPSIIHFGDAVTGTENHVNKVFPRVGFGEPTWICNLSSVASIREDLEDTLTIPRSRENIEVFCMAHNACLASQGISSTDEKGHLCSL